MLHALHCRCCSRCRRSLPRRVLSGFLWAFGTVVVMVLLICIPYGAPLLPRGSCAACSAKLAALH